jgi:hypothetical protein
MHSSLFGVSQGGGVIQETFGTTKHQWAAGRLSKGVAF